MELDPEAVPWWNPRRMISCKAPCKVNVSLRVLGKRPDGFHEVDTVMVPLDLCDVLEFSPAACLEMSCDAPGVPLDESNLVMKAGRLMERELGRPMPWHVRLVKRCPMVRGWAAAAVMPHACCAPSMSWNAEVCPGSAWRSWAGKSVPTWGFHLWRGEPLHRARREGGALAGLEGVASPGCLVEAVVWCLHAGRLPPLVRFQGIARHSLWGAGCGRPCAGQ